MTHRVPFSRRALGSSLVMSLVATALVVVSGGQLARADAAPGPDDTVRTFNADAGTVGQIPDGAGLREVLIPVSGLTTPITDVRVRFTADHDQLGDLGVFLVAPDGASTPVFERINGGAEASGVDGTLNFANGAASNLSVYATTVSDTANVTAGSFIAQKATGETNDLTAPFVNSRDGVWKLTFVDYVTGNAGVVSAATIQIATAPSSAALACANAKAAVKAGKAALGAAVKAGYVARHRLAKARRAGSGRAVAKAQKAARAATRALEDARRAIAAAKPAVAASC